MSIIDACVYRVTCVYDGLWARHVCYILAGSLLKVSGMPLLQPESCIYVSPKLEPYFVVVVDRKCHAVIVEEIFIQQLSIT